MSRLTTAIDYCVVCGQRSAIHRCRYCGALICQQCTAPTGVTKCLDCDAATRRYEPRQNGRRYPDRTPTAWDEILLENKADHRAYLENTSCAICDTLLIDAADHWDRMGNWKGCPARKVGRANPPTIPAYYAHRYWIRNLQEGDLAPDAFGNMRRVTSITYRGEDPNGKAYVGYYTEYGPTSQISNSIKEGEVLRTVAITNRMKSHEVDGLDHALNSVDEAIWTDGFNPRGFLPSGVELYSLRRS